MMSALIPLASYILRRHYGRYPLADREDMMAFGVEKLLQAVRRKAELRNTFGYFVRVLVSSMNRELEQVKSRVFYSSSNKFRMPANLPITHEMVEAEILSDQVSLLTWRGCRDGVRFKGMERDAVGYAIMQMMSGDDPSVPFVMRRWGMSRELAKFLVQYASVLWRRSQMVARYS